MKSLKLKGVTLVIASLLGVLYFGYTWLSANYNDTSNYDYLKNNFGQFTFFGFLMYFIYNVLKYLKKENFFPTFIIVSFLGIAIVYVITKIFLWPFIIVLAISLFFYSTRQWLVAKPID
jgi:hypothetical protein